MAHNLHRQQVPYYGKKPFVYLVMETKSEPGMNSCGTERRQECNRKDVHATVGPLCHTCIDKNEHVKKSEKTKQQ